MVGRLVDWIAEKRDSIWVHWVSQNYLKGQNWLDYQPSAGSSWVWRRICRVKQKISTGYVDGKWAIQDQGFTTGSKKPGLSTWHGVVSNAWVTPKHQFMGWLYANEALHTNEKLLMYGLDIDDRCFLCGQDTETQSHLFFYCEYSRRIMLCL
ncbi:uncharacterized protein LOC141651259 [Silene latifolia]|uniref:uncharacterized protein LOC141651259 n=1 Tax=Silene latifolia TaxID=37657 RepID=UPI003D78602B